MVSANQAKLVDICQLRSSGEDERDFDSLAFEKWQAQVKLLKYDQLASEMEANVNKMDKRKGKRRSKEAL